MRLAPLLAATLLAAACAGGDAATAPTTTKTTAAPATTTTAPPDPRGVAPVASAGCSAEAAASVQPGQEKITVTSGGTERWYLRRVPPAHDGVEPVPLVVDLHGYSEGAEIHVLLSALPSFGDEQGFITLTPQGQGAVARWDPSPTSTDMVFLADMLDQAEAALCVDEARVFVTGLSNGAMMTSAVACALADRVAAVAPVAGITDIAGCAPARPVPLIAFHGTADPFLSYEGGFGPAAVNLPAPDGSGQTLGDLGLGPGGGGGPSVEDVVAGWATRNGCDGEPEQEAVAADVTELVYPCPAGAEVELYRVEGGGHSWPGSEVSKQAESLLGPTTFSISANELMWKFFLDHPLPAG